MSHPVAPYPLNLCWRRVMSRLFMLGQILGMVGAMSMHATEALSPQQPKTVGLLYYVIWMQLVCFFGVLLTASSMLLVARRGWRLMPDAQARYERDGLYKGLPASTKWQLLLTTVLCVFVGSWLSQQCFIALQATPWGLTNLPQTFPLYKITLFISTYGTISVYLFEYFHDRSAVSEARERMARKLTAEAQLTLLRSQLDPHMLFNTLSNLYELIDESPQQARAMLLHLIGFLRSTLQGSRAAEHALADEFKLAADYLSLMQIRMGDRLRTTLALPETLSAAQVPTMLLQPLIENAIKHGLEQRKLGGELHVIAREEDEQLVLQVRNSGPMARETHGGLTQASSEPSSGFGLQYVKDRLHTLYGHGAHFEMKHLREADITEVTLRLPLRWHAAGAPTHTQGQAA